MKIKNFFNKVGNFVKPIFRGLIKSVPYGNLAIEVIDNIKTEAIDSKENKHNWLSISVQIISLSAIIYAFITKQITIEQLLQLLNYENLSK